MFKCLFMSCSFPVIHHFMCSIYCRKNCVVLTGIVEIVVTYKSAVLKIRKMEEFVYDEKHYSTIITKNDETEEEEIGPIIQVRM